MWKSHSCKEVFGERCVLNAKRLAETWYFYRYLITFAEITGSLAGIQLPYVKDLDQCLRNLKPLLLPYFVKKWSSNYYEMNF